MDHNDHHKNGRWVILTLPVIIVVAIVLRVTFDSASFFEELGFLVSILRFLIWGFVIFFILHPFVSYFERKLHKIKFNKLLAMIIVYFIFLFVLYCIFFLLLPSVVRSVLEITEVIPKYIDDAESIVSDVWIWVEGLGVSGLEDTIEQNIYDSIDAVIKGIGNISVTLLNTSYDLINSIKDFLIGIVISVYMIVEKDSLARRIKKLVYSAFDKDKADKICVTSGKSGIVFRKFIIGKSVDSMIVGIFSFFVLLIIGVPLPVLLAVIMALTNMIPTIGPIIGAVPCIIITLMFDPSMVIWVVLYILFVQTVDGMILGPKILGDTLGLKPFYIIVAVLIGAGLFGVLGAFLATPTLAVIKILLTEYTDRKLAERNLVIK